MHAAWTALSVGYRPLLIILLTGLAFIFTLLTLGISLSTEFKIPTRILAGLGSFLLLSYGNRNQSNL